MSAPSLSAIILALENAATKANVDIDKAFQFLAHLTKEFAPIATVVADVVETSTGNAELVPLTNEVSTGAQAVATAVIANQGNTIQQAVTVATAVEKASGNQDLVAQTNQAGHTATGILGEVGAIFTAAENSVGINK